MQAKINMPRKMIFVDDVDYTIIKRWCKTNNIQFTAAHLQAFKDLADKIRSQKKGGKASQIIKQQ